MNWKEHYSSLDALATKEETEAAPMKPKSKKLNKHMLKFIAELATNFAQMRHWQKQAEEEKARAQDITSVVPKPEKPNTLSSTVVRIVQKAEKPIHITDIINQVDDAGWKSKTKYHLYNQVQRALACNYDVIERLGKGNYKIRSRSIPIGGQLKQRAATNGKIATFKDIIATIARDYPMYNGATTPARVHYVLRHMGLRCAYSSVYRAMQSDRFVRDGFNYRVA